MTQEEKAKVYDKAIEKIKYVMKHGVSPTLNKEDLQDIFPELAESEDERTRKDIIHFVQSRLAGFPECERFVAWLEKQGENNKWKPSKDEMDALYGLAYITNEMDDRKDVAITKLYQDLKREFFEGASYENIFPSSPVDSDINIEKQGEQKDINPTLLEKEKMDNAFTQMMFKGKTALEAIKEEKVDNAIKVEQKPYGQKEECFNCQFNYAGHCKGYCELKKQVPKPKWSEEDEGMMNHCIGAIHIAGCHVTNSYTEKDKKAMKDWLKSLKQKIGE